MKWGGQKNKNLIQKKNRQMICPYLSEVFIRKALLVKISHRFMCLCSFAVLQFCKLVTVPEFLHSEECQYSEEKENLLNYEYLLT